MTYVVNTTPQAEYDFSNLYDFCKADESDTALDWYLGLKAAILTFAEHPERCPIIPEAKRLRRQLRHLLYGTKPHIYRVIYQVEETERRVIILHIRHGARRRLRQTELE